MLKYEPEIWVDLKDDKLQGTEDKYQISSYGRVYNKQDKCFVSPVLTGKPAYYYVNLLVGKTRKLRRVHYLQAYSFYGEPPVDDKGVYYTCDHSDRNKYNNSISNLRWLDRKGQMLNRNEQKSSLKYKLKVDYNLEGDVFKNSIYQYFSSKLREGHTYEEVQNMYEDKKTVLNGITTTMEELCSIFRKDLKICSKLYREGNSLEDIFIHFKIKEKDFSSSYEIEGRWFPSKTSIAKFYNIDFSEVNELLIYGEYDKYIEKRNKVAATRKFTNKLRRERFQGHNWGDGYFGSIRGIANKYNIDQGTLWYRINKEGMTMKEALEAPSGNISHYWKINNKWYNKQELCDKFNVKQSSVTQRIAKGDALKYAILNLGGVRNVIFNINGNIFSKLDLANKHGIESKQLNVTKKYSTHKELFLKLGIITEGDYFEEIKRRQLQE